jgi:hypothetical protein
MSELSVDRLRVMLGREGNRAEAAERQVRDQAAEIAKLRSELAAAKAEGASLGTPILQDGYSLAFYELAKLMGIGARPAAPGHVWRSEMLPRLIRALAADAASYADTLNLENARD